MKKLLIAVILFSGVLLNSQDQERKLDLSKPLGDFQNPVKCSGPGGEKSYLWRLRTLDAFEEPTSVSRDGSVGFGPYNHILDRYTVMFGKKKISVHMDMYFDDYREKRPIPGFAIVSTISPQLLFKNGLYYKLYDKKKLAGKAEINRDKPYTGEIEDKITGKVYCKMTLKKGMLEGKMTHYHKNGKLMDSVQRFQL